MILVWFSFLLGVDLLHKETVTLDIPLSPTLPEIVASSNGSFFYAVFWHHVIHHVDAEGKLIRTFGGQGQGPREMFKPYKMLLMEDGKTLVVAEANRRIFKISLNDPDQDFEVLQDFFPCGSLVKWDETHFLVCVGGRPGTETYFHVVDLTGRIVKSWMTKDQLDEIDDSHPIRVGRDATFVTADKSVFYQDGGYPKLWEISGKAPKEWCLTRPKHFVKAPDEPFDSSKRFDRVAAEEYYSKFTWLFSLNPIGETYMGVCWWIRNPYPCSLDIYRMPERKLLKSNIELPGQVVHTSGNLIYVLEIKELEGDEIEFDETHLIHVFELRT